MVFCISFFLTERTLNQDEHSLNHLFLFTPLLVFIIGNVSIAVNLLNSKILIEICQKDHLSRVKYWLYSELNGNPRVLLLRYVEGN